MIVNLKQYSNQLSILTFLILSISASFALYKQSISFFDCNIWFDESVQFWISKGISPDAQIGSIEGTIAEVWESNKHFNLDPGGFGVLLHYWSKVSNSLSWLRLLPFSFFLMSMVVMYQLGLIWSENNKNIALAVAIIPCFTPQLFILAYELRAYSMEVLGTICCVYVLFNLDKRQFNPLPFGLLISFFCLSRYSEIVIAFALVVSILITIVVRKKTDGQISFVEWAIFAAILLSVVLILYFNVISFQNKNIKPLFYLDYLGKNPEKLLNPSKLAFVVFGILLPTGRLIYLSLKKRFEIEFTFLFFSVFVQLLFLVLSFSNMHPWDPYSNRNISIQILFLLLAAYYLCLIFRSSDLRFPFLSYLILVITVIFFAYLRRHLYQMRYSENSFMCFVTRGFPEIKSNRKILIDGWAGPRFKYLVQYGDLKHMDNVWKKNVVILPYKPHEVSDDYEGELFFRNQANTLQINQISILIIPKLKNYISLNKNEWEKRGHEDLGIFAIKEKVN